MKKRRELDALVNGKLSKSKNRTCASKKGSGHELLKNESDSSDVEEFSLTAQKTIIRHGPSRLCTKCVPICGFFLLVACVVAVGGLIWVHIKLRSDLDHLRSQLMTVESGSKTNPDTFQEIHTKLKEVEDRVNRLQKDNTDLASRVTTVQQDVAKLQGTTNGLQDRLKDSPALANLPKSVADLSKNVADFGSEIKTLQSNVNGLSKFKTDEEARVTALENLVHSLEASKYVSTTVAPSVSTAAPAVNQYVQQRLEVLSHDLSLVNVSTEAQLVKLTSQILQQQVRLEGLKNTTNQLQARIGLLELTPSSNKPNMSDINAIITEAVSHVASQLQNASNSHQMADQGTLTELANQIQNITDLVTDYKQQFNQFKGDWASGKLDHINLNITAGYDEIMKNAMNAYTAKTQTQVQDLNESLSDLNKTVRNLQESVERQAVTLSSLTTAQNQTAGLHEHGAKTETYSTSSTVTSPTTGLKTSVPIVTQTATTSSPTLSISTASTDVKGHIDQNEMSKEKNVANKTAADKKNAEEKNEKDQSAVEKNDGSSAAENDDKSKDFQRIDTDGDGFITREEMKEYFGEQAPPEDFYHMYDKDNDGKLSYEEMQHAMGWDNTNIFPPDEMPQEKAGIKKKSVHSQQGQGEVSGLFGALHRGP